MVSDHCPSRITVIRRNAVRHLTGHDFIVDGHKTGGVFGHGQTWYTWARGQGNLYGRYIAPA